MTMLTMMIGVVFVVIMVAYYVAQTQLLVIYIYRSVYINAIPIFKAVNVKM